MIRDDIFVLLYIHCLFNCYIAIPLFLLLFSTRRLLLLMNIPIITIRHSIKQMQDVNIDITAKTHKARYRLIDLTITIGIMWGRWCLYWMKLCKSSSALPYEVKEFLLSTLPYNNFKSQEVLSTLLQEFWSELSRRVKLFHYSNSPKGWKYSRRFSGLEYWR